MTRPDWCPEDVWEVADDVAYDVEEAYGAVDYTSAKNVVARAIQNERERCAKVAETVRVAGASTPRQASRVIAAAIRAGDPA